MSSSEFKRAHALIKAKYDQSLKEIESALKKTHDKAYNLLKKDSL